MYGCHTCKIMLLICKKSHSLISHLFAIKNSFVSFFILQMNESGHVLVSEQVPFWIKEP